MRKNIVYFILFIFISVLFSCDFQIPTAVEIQGNPDIRLAAKKDIGSAFTNVFKTNSGNDLNLIECINTGTRTYMLYKVFPLTLPTMPPGDFNVPSDFNGVLGGNDANVKAGFDGIVSGFTLEPAVARVFVKGNSNLLNLLNVEVTVTSLEHPLETYDKFNRGESGVSGDVYYGTSIPGPSSTSTNMPLHLDDTNLKITFKVSLKPGDYKLAWFDGGLSSEILIWVPLVFTADSDASEIVIPSGTLFPVGEDLFGRGSGGSFPLDGLVESLELSIVLKKNPFDGRDLVITSTGGINIEHKMRGNAFSFPIDKNNMERLNDPSTIPFVPNFKIKYKTDERLEFPWDLSSTTFVFKAKINKRMEL